MKHHPHQVKETVRGKLDDATNLGLSAREIAATELALRSLETATSLWTDDIDRELEDELAECDWTYPHLAALARRIIREADEAAS